MSNYVPNGEWDLITVQVKRNVVRYSCCEGLKAHSLEGVWRPAIFLYYNTLNLEQIPLQPPNSM